MAPGGDRGLSAVDARRWLRGLQLFHVGRLLLTVAFVALVVFSVLAPVRCTPADPGVCGPSSSGTWVFALILATPILLLCAPALGCLSALALAVLGARYDPAHVTHGWWAAGGVLSVAVLVHLTLIRIRQHRIAAARTEPRPGPVLRATRTVDGIRLWFIAVAAVTGIVLTVIYQDKVSAKQDHLRHAQPLVASYSACTTAITPWICASKVCRSRSRSPSTPRAPTTSAKRSRCSPTSPATRPGCGWSPSRRIRGRGSPSAYSPCCWPRPRRSVRHGSGRPTGARSTPAAGCRCRCSGRARATRCTRGAGPARRSRSCTSMGNCSSPPENAPARGSRQTAARRF
jgi:hypothetical protein